MKNLKKQEKFEQKEILEIISKKNIAKRKETNEAKNTYKNIYIYLHIAKSVPYRQITRAANEADSLPINYMTKYAFPISKPGFV